MMVYNFFYINFELKTISKYFNHFKMSGTDHRRGQKWKVQYLSLVADIALNELNNFRFTYKILQNGGLNKAVCITCDITSDRTK